MIQTTTNSPFLANKNEFTSDIPGTCKRYIDVNIGKGILFFANKPSVPCLINDSNKDVFEIYKNLNDAAFHQEVETCTDNWILLAHFSRLSAKEIYISFLDFLKNIITQEDIQYMVRAIVLMNTDVEKFSSLFSNNFVISHDMFINALIKSVVNELVKLKSTTGNYSDTDMPDSFVEAIETAFRSGYFTHFQNLINWQNTDLIDCMVLPKYLAIWYFIIKTAKGNKIITDENGNLKSQYAGSQLNTINFKDCLQLINEDSFFNNWYQHSFSSLPIDQFLSSIAIQDGDFILADLRASNQFTSSRLELKQKNTYSQLIKQLLTTKAQWMVIMEYDCLIHEIVKENGLHLKEDSTHHDIAIVTNYA